MNEQALPMWSFPLTVSGGVSMAKTRARGADRSNLYYRGLVHRRDHFSTRPSSEGLAGAAPAGARRPLRGGVSMPARISRNGARRIQGIRGECITTRPIATTTRASTTTTATTTTYYTLIAPNRG